MTEITESTDSALLDRYTGLAVIARMYGLSASPKKSSVRSNSARPRRS